jgi:hypothetical protein
VRFACGCAQASGRKEFVLSFALRGAKAPLFHLFFALKREELDSSGCWTSVPQLGERAAIHGRERKGRREFFSLPPQAGAQRQRSAIKKSAAKAGIF